MNQYQLIIDQPTTSALSVD